MLISSDGFISAISHLPTVGSRCSHGEKKSHKLERMHTAAIRELGPSYPVGWCSLTQSVGVQCGAGSSQHSGRQNRVAGIQQSNQNHR